MNTTSIRILGLVLVAAVSISIAATTPAESSERLTGIACRSVHLQYPAPPAVAFYNEMTVEESAEGSYFMACGFNAGYFGIQERRSDKVVIFSVWDSSSTNDPNATPEDQRVQALDQGEDVEVKRFGGEGTGGQSFYPYDWKTGERYRFFVTARPDGNRTVFSGYFYIDDEKRWQLLASFSTPTERKLLRGYYSFVEDFRRNRVSTTHTRKASFGNGWVSTKDGEWRSLSTAKFTADGNRATNINAGIANGRFFLATGGEIANDDTPLGDEMTLAESESQPPSNLPPVQTAE